MRKDSQMSGLAGELFVAAELLKRNIQVTLSLGNAKSVDLVAFDDSQTFRVQVKTLRTSNCYLLRVQDVIPENIYVFVLLHEPGTPVEYFILRGNEIIAEQKSLYGRGGSEKKTAGILITPLRKKYKDRWQVFTGCTITLTKDRSWFSPNP